MNNSNLPTKVSLKIYNIRGHKVMFDHDLAEIYGTETKFINLAVKRNPLKFPIDFCFQLTEIEWEYLRLQSATSKQEGRGGRRNLPRVFTEHGIIMLATVLRTPIAIQVSIEVVRIFIEMRKIAADYSILDRKINFLEQKFGKKFAEISEVIQELMRKTPGLDPDRKKIGLKSERKNNRSDN